MIWRQPSSNLFWKSHHLTKIFWKTTAPFLTFISVQNPWKSGSPQNSVLSPRKQPQQSLSVSLSSRMQHRDCFVTCCKRYSLHSGQWQHLCSSFIWSFCSFWHYQPPNTPLLPVFGIQSTVLQWFQSILSDRYQSASVNNLSSSPSQLMYIVPQGSILGPVLFVLYTMPLFNIIANHSINHQLLADNTQLQKTALSEVTNLTKELDACTDDIVKKGHFF